MKAYWRTSTGQRWRQEDNSQVAYERAVAYLRSLVGSEGFTPDQIEKEVEARTPAVEVILEDEYARRGGTVHKVREVPSAAGDPLTPPGPRRAGGGGG